MRRLFYIVVLLLPLAAFVACLLEVRRMIDAGASMPALLLMFAALALMTLIEGLIFKYWVLPGWGQAISERLYAGNYTPDDDPLVMLAEKIRREKDAALLPELVRMVHRDAGRLRSWQELANIQLQEFSQAEEAVETMLKGAAKVHPAEDRAFLLYRAATTCEKHLQNTPRAQELYAQVARRYPRTAYGKMAAKRG